MARVPIIRDLSATIEIDPEAERINMMMETLTHSLETSDDEDKEEIESKLKEIENDLHEYEALDDKPVIVIGYIPPAKLLSLRAESAKISIPEISAVDISKLPIEEQSALADYTEKISMLNRKVCRWGVRGWRIYSWEGKPIKVEFDNELFDGRKYKAASHEAIDIIETTGWLSSIANAIWKYNRLSEEDQKK